jgi:hypothetical protein
MLGVNLIVVVYLLLTKLEELENLAQKYHEIKHNSQKNERNYKEKKNSENNDIKTTSSTAAGDAAQIAADIVDSISISSFSFPLKKETQTIGGTTTYVYESNATFPAFYDFLAEILHLEIPLEIGAAKLGPGEIIVNKEDKNEADKALKAALKELQELVHAKKSEVMST